MTTALACTYCGARLCDGIAFYQYTTDQQFRSEYWDHAANKPRSSGPCCMDCSKCVICRMYAPVMFYCGKYRGNMLGWGVRCQQCVVGQVIAKGRLVASTSTECRYCKKVLENGSPFYMYRTRETLRGAFWNLKYGMSCSSGPCCVDCSKCFICNRMEDVMFYYGPRSSLRLRPCWGVRCSLCVVGSQSNVVATGTLTWSTQDVSQGEEVPPREVEMKLWEKW